MDRKITLLLIILICSICCLNIISAGNNTTDNLTSENNGETSDNFIIPVHITDNGIKFSDGFTGFCIDSSKNIITADDKFTAHPTSSEEHENNVKLAIIESYKAGEENNIGNIVAQVLNGNKEYNVAQAVFNSTESVGDTAVVVINNTTEATFTFELLKSADGSKSDCLAYTVSFRTISNDGPLGASNNNNESSTNETANQTSNSNAQPQTNTTTENNNTNDTGNSNGGQTTANETNETNTVTVNVNNTTIINQNNTKVINKTNEPQNATIPEKIMKATGNPIFILAIVIVVIAIVAVAMRRRN